MAIRGSRWIIAAVSVSAAWGLAQGLARSDDSRSLSEHGLAVQSRIQKDPSSSELGSIESDLQSWKRELESALSSSSPLSVETRLGAINRYFQTLSSLTTRRIALKLSHTEQWQAQFALRLPSSSLRDLPGLGAQMKDSGGMKLFALSLTRSGDTISLALSESLIQGLELGALATHPDSDSYRTMIQALASRQLLQNLADLNALKDPGARPVSPAVPAELTRRLETLGLGSFLVREKESALREPVMRTALAASFSEIASTLPAFRSVVASGAADTGAASARLIQAVSDELNAASLPLAEMPDSELELSLRHFVSNAAAHAELDLAIELENSGRIHLEESEKQRLLDRLEKSKRSYSSSIPSRLIARWISSARRASAAEFGRSRRTKLLRSLIEASRRLKLRLDSLENDDKMDFNLLARSLAPRLAKLAPRQTVRDWYYEIAHSDDFTAARDRYAEIMVAQTSDDMLESGLVSPERVKKYLSTHDFASTARFSKSVNPALASRLLSKVTQGRKKDISDLLAVGELLGFHRTDLSDSPKLGELITDRSGRRSYLKTLRTDLLRRYPVLSMSVGLPVEHPITRGKLHEALVALAGMDSDLSDAADPAYVKAAPLLDQCLARLEKKIQDDLAAIGEARDLSKISQIVTGAMMMELVMSGYPEFQDQQDEFVDSLLRPSLTQQIMRRQVGAYLSYGFGALMLMQGVKFFVKPAAPFVDIVMKGTEPLIKGYMASATALMAAETAGELEELHKQREASRRAEDFFLTSTEGNGLIDFSEMQAADSSYQMSRWMFLGRISMDGAFMYLPMLKPWVKNFASVAGDVAAFRRLGMRPGDWQGLPKSLGELKSASPESLKALRRLESRVINHQTWDAKRALIPGAASEKAFAGALIPLDGNGGHS